MLVDSTIGKDKLLGYYQCNVAVNFLKGDEKEMKYLFELLISVDLDLSVFRSLQNSNAIFLS